VTAELSSFEITGQWIAARRWKSEAGLLHAFSTRHTGRERFFASFPGCRSVLLRQAHSDRVLLIAAPPRGMPRADAMVTDHAGLALALKTADCLPILLYDREHRAIGAVHAGWRGTAARIAEKAAGAMRAHFGCDPAHIEAVIGPGIQACCYQVGQPVIDKFRSQFPYAEELFKALDPENPADIRLPRQVMTEGSPPLRNLEAARARLDLVLANRRQLEQAGLRPHNIISGAPCTACHTDLLYSYRREGQAAGRLFSAIALR
jgi:hypothetical protein